MATSFAATVDAWVLETKARTEAVFKKSVERLAEEVKNPANMPVVTGFLRRSLMASTTAMPAIDLKAAPKKGSVHPDNAGEIFAVIAGAELGDTIYLGFTAAYARRMEYGFTGTDSLGRTHSQTGRGFVRLAAQNWSTIVEKTAADLKASVASRAKLG